MATFTMLVATFLTHISMSGGWVFCHYDDPYGGSPIVTQHRAPHICAIQIEV